jgi:hypothetical protein
MAKNLLIFKNNINIDTFNIWINFNNSNLEKKIELDVECQTKVCHSQKQGRNKSSEQDLN